MVGRYGKHLSGSDVQEADTELESLEFDEETRELIGLDDIAEIVGEIEETEIDVEAMEEEAQAIQEGEDIDESERSASATEIEPDVDSVDDQASNR